MQYLAAQDILFRQVHTASPTCSPSRAALLTGQMPHNNGMLGLAHRGFSLRHPERHLATVLASAGYETVLAGFQHVANGDPTALGYTTLLKRDDFHAASVMHDTTDWLEQRATSAQQQPFFLDAGVFEAHRPFPELDETAGRYIRPLPTLPDVPETRHTAPQFPAPSS